MVKQRKFSMRETQCNKYFYDFHLNTGSKRTSREKDYIKASIVSC